MRIDRSLIGARYGHARIGNGACVALTVSIAIGIAGLSIPLPAQEHASNESVVASSDQSEEAADVGQSFRDVLRSGGLGPEMVTLPPGRFYMGVVQLNSTRAQYRRPPGRVEDVTISKPLAMSKYPITFDDYDRYLESTEHHRFDEARDNHGWGRGRRPVINILFYEAEDYAAWLSEQTGEGYRLPSEAEWEYAAKAGTRMRWFWGNEIGRNRANCYDCGSRWDNKKTSPVGSFPANPWGLHDMHGNVWEMVQDCFHRSYTKALKDGSARTQPGRGGPGPRLDDRKRCKKRVLRGGSWWSHHAYTESRVRGLMETDQYMADVGFRVVREIGTDDD